MGDKPTLDKSIARHPDSSVHNQILRIQTTEDVFKKYEIIEILGSGSMGTVSKVRLRSKKVGGSAFDVKPKGIFGHLKKGAKKLATGKNSNARPELSHDYEYALKSIIIDRVSPLFLEELKNEIEILKTMDHPNIVKAHEVYAWKDRQIYVVMELLDGGDLYTRSPYSEREACIIVEKMASAIMYMHNMGVVHRDLKLENCVFESKNDDAEVKIIDFGLSKQFGGTLGLMTERVGTIYTMAPQVLQGIYSSQSDCWSLGVIGYTLIAAAKPFHSRKRKRTIDMIMRAHFSLQTPIWDNVSDDAKDFVKQLIVVDPRKRMSAADALKHPWIENRELHANEVPTQEVLSQIKNSLVNYRQTTQLKKLALNVIAHRSTTQEIIGLRKIFATYDVEKNGVLSFEEFQRALSQMNYSEEELAEIFSSIDVNHNGLINYTEFVAATIEQHGRIGEDRIASAFDRMDSDDSVYIYKKNLEECLGPNYPSEEIDSMIKAADKNGDGKLSYSEFLASFREETGNVFLAARRNEDCLASSIVTTASADLLDINTKIPGGRFDSNLEPSLRRQIE